ncbi:hypothetical protein GBA52_025957 [Prunus armeniaca]|nr:hypothetical protein GBA52_025957 [Prunus armeniaca]
MGNGISVGVGLISVGRKEEADSAEQLSGLQLEIIFEIISSPYEDAQLCTLHLCVTTC